MSLVVMVLQGLVAAETDLDYSLPFPTMTRRVAGTNQEREAVVGISLPLPSQLLVKFQQCDCIIAPPSLAFILL